VAGAAPGSLRILIVEDETIVALDLKERIRALGYEPCGIADTPDKAKDLALAQKPALILMDIMLKGNGDGIDAAAAIKALMDVPVVFVTAFSDEDTLKRVKATSPYGYIVKPYHERELRISIELALAKHQSELELIRAKRAAEESDRAKTRFLSNLSHEFVTPINSMLGFLELALPLARDEELAEYLSMVASSAHKLETLLFSLLDYAKLESGSLMPIVNDFYLEDFLLRCWVPYRVEAYGKGLGLRFYIEPGLPETAQGDSAKLSIIVKNLLENAVKFTDEGSVCLEARRSGERDLELLVIDTGPGIALEESDRLFLQFTQADDSSTRKIGGLGIGLTLAKGLCELLGATLSLEPGPVGGTVFRVLLPSALHGDAAFPRPGDRLGGAVVALMQADALCAPDVERWSKALSIGIRTPDNAAGDAELALCGSAAWHALSESERAASLEAFGAKASVLVLGSPVDNSQCVLSNRFVMYRPYPLGLSVFLDALAEARARAADDAQSSKPRNDIRRIG
jgi:signal transduction histidine kinase